MEQIIPETALTLFVVLVLAVVLSGAVIIKLRNSLKVKDESLTELQRRFAPVLNVEAEVIESQSIISQRRDVLNKSKLPEPLPDTI